MVNIGATYRRLLQIQQSFRMAKSDLKVRSTLHTLGDSIDAHLTVVMTKLAVGRWLELMNWSLKKPVQTLRGYRQMGITVDVDGHEADAAAPAQPI